MGNFENYAVYIYIYMTFEYYSLPYLLAIWLDILIYIYLHLGPILFLCAMGICYLSLYLFFYIHISILLVLCFFFMPTGFSLMRMVSLFML